jgi:hypothetical protein
MNFIKEKYFLNRNFIKELIIFCVFLIFILDYLGIPDKYDYFILWTLNSFLIFNIFLYLRFVIKDYQKLLKEELKENRDEE